MDALSVLTPESLKTRAAMKRAPGAMPIPSPATMMPMTWVP